MHWYPPEGNTLEGLSPHAHLVVARLAAGTFEIDFECLADALAERLKGDLTDREARRFSANPDLR